MARVYLGQLIKPIISETDDNSLIVQESINTISLLFIAIFLFFALNIIGSMISFRFFFPQDARTLETNFFGFNFEILLLVFTILWFLVIFYIIYRLIRKRTLMFNNDISSVRDIITIPFVNFKIRDVSVEYSRISNLTLSAQVIKRKNSSVFDVSNTYYSLAVIYDNNNQINIGKFNTREEADFFIQKISAFIAKPILDKCE